MISLRVFFVRLWATVKSWFEKREKVEKFTVPTPRPKPEMRKKRPEKKKSTYPRPLGHQTFGQFRPLRRLPKFIAVGSNWERSVWKSSPWSKKMQEAK